MPTKTSPASKQATYHFDQVVIENIYPVIDDGRFAAKRVVGESFEVWADIFTTGYTLLKAALCVTANGQPVAEHPMALQGNDRWSGQAPLAVVGQAEYCIKAWPDLFGSWLRDAQKKFAVGEDITLDILEGKALFVLLFGNKPTGEKKEAYTQIQTILELPDQGELIEVLATTEIADWVHKHGARPHLLTSKTYPLWVDRKIAEFGAWYEMFARSQGTVEGQSATFDDCIARLPEIKAMGFDVVYLPPIHPIGLPFRKGKNNSLNAGPDEPGSPYAICDHKAVHPELGTLADFRRFAAAANDMGMDVALDFAVQCAPDHPYIKAHPEWFIFRPDGSIKYAENPPKKYQDIVNFDFSSADAGSLWEELRSIVLHWIEQGVTIFRVDNPHTKPFGFWEWLIKSVHATRPDIIFLSEAFTRPKVMAELAKLGFSQSYSYFTWRNTKPELTQYLTELTADWSKEFFRPNFFVTTPDIFPYYLHTSGRPGYLIRAVLAATLGTTYGIYNGYELCEGEPFNGKEEYPNSEKYEYKVWDWNKPGHIKDFITKLNTIRQENLALQEFKNLKFYTSHNDNIIFYGKMTADKRNAVFVAVNLDPHNTQAAHIEMPLWELGIPENQPYKLDDLLLGHSWTWAGVRQHLNLDPNINPVAIFRISQNQ